MAKSSSATAAASGRTKRKSKSGTLTLEEVKSLGRELLSSRAHLNHAPVLLALVSPSAPLDLALEALISLQSFFVPLIPSIPSAAAAAAGDASSDPELVFGSWLRQRFDELVTALVELSVSPQSDDAIRDVALDALMDFVKLGKDGKFQSAIYHKFLHALVHATDPIEPLLELLGPKYFKYADVCYFTYTTLDKIANSLGIRTTGSGKGALLSGGDGSENRGVIFIHNIYNILGHVPVIDFQNESAFEMLSTVGISSKGEKDSSKDSSTYIKRKLKLKFTKAWLSFLKLPLPLDVYKEVLASIHQNVIPSMSNPAILCDFLTRSYDIGGVISVMALSGLFILMTQHGLEYPKFYEKLYALMTPAVFMAKHRSVFLQLLDTCLKSSYLPAYLAAAFAKRLSRLALSVPPAGALIIIALIHNLLRRHPSINFLVHWEVDESNSNATGEANQTKKIGADPFNNQEIDPAKSGAMRSSLWEINTLRHHYSPAVSRFVESLENDLTVRAKTTEMKITDFSSGSYATVFRDENISVRPNVVNIGALFSFNSTIGRAANVAIVAAVSDINNDSSILKDTKLVVQMQDTNCSGFLGIVQALKFMEKDTVAIIGPQSSVIAHVISHVANELQVPLVSFAATDPTLTSLQYPYFVRGTHSDQFQMASVADLVEYYGWKLVTAVFIDDDYGRNGISALGDELDKRKLKILYKAAIKPGAKKSEMAAVLVRAAMMESRVFILHANVDSGLAVLSLAYNLSMTSGGYVWIATDWLSSFLDSSPRLDMGLMSVLQGVLTLRQHTQNTRRKKILSSQWSALAKGDSGGSSFLLNSYGFYAYDAVWIIAHALDAFFNMGGNISFSLDPKLHQVAGGTLNFDALSIFDGGRLLLERIRQVNFTGATGPVTFDSDGNLIQPAYDILNIVGSGVRTIGYWSNYSGLSTVAPGALNGKPSSYSNTNKKLYTAIWPGETTTRPRGWVFPNNGNELRIGIPDRVSYRQFVSSDAQTGIVGGFCIDVFVAAINLLQYPVPYKFVPFGNGRENPSYTELINRILANEFDGVVGDIAIVTNRTKVVDFTQPYIGSGLVILTSVKKQSSSGWAFLQPFTIRMWCVTGVFFLIIGTVVWLLEHRINDDFRGPPAKQAITVIWFSFSTLFFAHREDTRSTLGRFVIIIWLFVVLIIQSSYTASLTSILTVQQLSSPIKGIDSLIASGEPIGFQVGSFAESYLVNELGVSPSRLKSLGTPDEYKDALELGPRKGGVAAIVDERPYIELFLSGHDKVAIVGSEFTKSGWGFAFPRDSPLAVDLSTAILTLSETGDLQRIHDKWLPGGSSAAQTDDLDPDRLHVHSFSALFLICGLACVLALSIHGCVLYNQYRRHVASSSDPAAGSSRSHRGSLRSFLSFADHRETEFRKSSKDGAAMAAGGSGSASGVSFTSSSSVSTSMSR
ncbi:hypothetical protein EJB05_39555 [Eragrostis curvula]|uniref:Ionotropic glutamate receptor C-terminal domain-containing protein n=1 Tax=Eragrostis curvula TaxID=38414 RepID=A0A5J9TX91_9POAL|nr:hypothetical protein EJB05_39555 [Eragrostis curvula]